MRILLEAIEALPSYAHESDCRYVCNPHSEYGDPPCDCGLPKRIEHIKELARKAAKRADTSPLDEALNSGDGTYKP